MPGTLLPYEILTELKDVAGQIVDELLARDTDALVVGTAGPALYLVEHSIDATVLGLSIGRRLLPDEQLRELGTGLFLQDIGKLALPPGLALKPGPLAPDEWGLMMQHPLLGLEFLRDDSISTLAKSVVRFHHERWDGSGYPSGLVGEETPLVSRIASVADVFDAVTSERFHARELTESEGADLIRAGAGRVFDPTVVEAFLDAVGR